MGKPTPLGMVAWACPVWAWPHAKLSVLINIIRYARYTAYVWTGIHVHVSEFAQKAAESKSRHILNTHKCVYRRYPWMPDAASFLFPEKKLSLKETQA